MKCKAVFSLRPAHCRTFTQAMGEVELRIDMQGEDREAIRDVADEFAQRLQMMFLYLEDEDD